MCIRDRCNITDTGMKEIGKNCHQLQLLHIGYIDSITLIDIIGNLTQLQSLFCLDNDGITNNSIKEISKCSNLKELCLCECKNIDDDGIILIGKFQNLNYLHICGSSNITDNGRNELRQKLSSNTELYLNFDQC